MGGRNILAGQKYMVFSVHFLEKKMARVTGVFLFKINACFTLQCAHIGETYRERVKSIMSEIGNGYE